MVLQSNEDLLPIEWATEVIKAATQESALLSMANANNRLRMLSTRITRLPVTNLLASAFFVGSADNDFTDLKQQTDAGWAGVDLVVEDIAVLVPIPHAYEQDNAFPVWSEVRPQLVEAVGKVLDAAALFNVNKPTSWPAAIMTSINAVGQATEEGAAGNDIAGDIALSAGNLAETGHITNGFLTKPAFGWQLVGLRATDGTPIYQQNLSGPITTGLYGFPMISVSNGSWDSSQATVIHGDWTKSIVGIRQDMTFTRHESGIISDSSGNVLFNAMQQDSSIWRLVMRVGWATANPATRLAPNADTPTGKFPFAAVVPVTSA